MSMAAMYAADLEAMIDLWGNTPLVHTCSGTGTVTNIDRTLSFKIISQFGFDNVPCYQLDNFKTRFQDSWLATVPPKMGDLVSRASVVYEVVNVEHLTITQQWRLECQRAYLAPGYTTTALIERSAISQNAAKQDAQTWSTLYASASCYRNPQNVPTEMGTNFGVLGVNNRSKLYLASNVTGVRATDRVTIGTTQYTVLSTQNDSRIALLPELELQRLA